MKKRTDPLEVMPVKEEKELISWQAYSRPFQKKNRDFWVTAFSVIGLVCVILFVVGELGLITALLSLVFLYYVLTTVKPEEVNYRITTKGVYFPGAEQRIDWELLKSFYFTEKWNYPLLKLETFVPSLPLISLVIKNEEKINLEKLLKKYLPEGKEEKNIADKISRWIYDHLPFEIEKKQETEEKNSIPGQNRTGIASSGG